MIPRVIMRIVRQVTFFLLLVASPVAFARGGPGGALGDMLEWMLMLVLVSGVIFGAIVGWLVGRMPWKVVALVFVLLLGVGVTEPVFGVFIGIPAGVFIAVFATVSDVVRSGPLLSARQESGVRLAAIRDLTRWVAGTYLFWALVSLASFELLGFLAVPPLVIAFPKAVIKFLPFILPPLAIALGSGVIAVAAFYAVRRRVVSNHYLGVFIFNACVLIVFFASAEVYRDRLMSEALYGHEPVNLHYFSFLHSVLSYRTFFRPSHAGFVEDGSSYHWSYAERKFIQ